MTARKLTPKETLAEATRDALSQVTKAAQDAETRLVSAAREAHKVVISSAGDRGEQWENYRKLVMSELGSLKQDLKDGFDKISEQFKTHDMSDSAVFARINADIRELDRKFARIDERTTKQLWIVYGSALGSGIAILAHWVR